MTIVAADAQMLTFGNEPWLAVGMVRTGRSRTISRNTPLNVECVLVSPLQPPGSELRAPTIRQNAPAYAVLWMPGLQVQIDGRDVVLTLDGALDHRRIRLRTR